MLVDLLHLVQASKVGLNHLGQGLTVQALFQGLLRLTFEGRGVATGRAVVGGAVAGSIVPGGVVAPGKRVTGELVNPGAFVRPVRGGVGYGETVAGEVAVPVVVGFVPSLTGDPDDGSDAMGGEVSTFVGENVGLSVTGFPVGDCVGMGSIGPSDGSAGFKGIAVGEKVGANVDGTLDGSDFREEVGTMDGTIVGAGESVGPVEGTVLGESLRRTPVDHSSKAPSSPDATRVVPLIKSLLKP